MKGFNVKKMFDLEGKIAVVGGGAGALGSTLAKGLAEVNADIVIAGIDPIKRLKNIALDIEKTGRKSLAIKCDFTKEKDVENMVKKILDRFGRIDIFINASGIARRGKAEEMSVEDWQAVMDANVRGVFIGCKVVGKEMLKQGKGKIINISSVRDCRSAPLSIAYGPSKGAVKSLTKHFALEWASRGVCVNAIAPAVFKTPLTAEVFKKKNAIKNMTKFIPMGRIAVPEDFIGAAIFLSSSASDFVTGHILYVDGGLTC